MHTLRTRIGKDIIAEFMPPASYWRRKKGKEYKDKVIILADGLPTVPSKQGLIDYLSKKGYWVFYPRYRGSWESGGTLFARSPHEDISDIIYAIRRGRIDELWDRMQFQLRPTEITLVGSSFGGAAVLITGAHVSVDRIIAISPLVDWTKKSRTEPTRMYAEATKRAFGNAYRVSKSGWKKILSGHFFNPVSYTDKLKNTRLCIIHAKDDDVIAIGPVSSFGRACNATTYIDQIGGHMGLSTIMKPKYWKRVEKFLKS